MAPLPPRTQRSRYDLGHTVNRYMSWYLARLTDDNEGDTSCMLSMLYTGDERHETRRRMTGRQCILALGLHTAKEMAEDGLNANC
ncbi:hypothetical protein Tco_1090309 [Tanacetum coccineum]|uniref:Uncharacterized protein n=1 Tax=Tanacetum coccineum TaxID=301880 RepID=A0ABQ5I431_9ASTR